jgi:excisionase family DNA binding protein
MYLTVKQAAGLLNLKPETVQKWLRDGKIKGIKLSRKVWRVAETDLDRFIENKQCDNCFHFQEYKHCSCRSPEDINTPNIICTDWRAASIPQ